MTYGEDIGVIVNYKIKRGKISKYQGDKTSTVCPRCGVHKFIFDGKWKRCLQCGFDNHMEKRIRAFKYLYKRGRVKEFDISWVRDTADYIRNLGEVKQCSTK